MHRAWLAFLFVVLAALPPGCSCAHNAGKGSDGGAGADMSLPISGGDILIMPPEATLDLNVGGPSASQTYSAKTKSGQDVTGLASFTVDDTSLGGFAANVFTTTTTDHGGTTYVRARYNGLSGFATLHVKLHASVTSVSCPGCPPFPSSAPPCSAMAQTPTILYPPDGTLVPPNMNVLETQFDRGQGNALYEIDYENAATDVRVETQCNPIADSKKNATNGCAYDLSQQVWDWISATNRGGDPVQVIVKATDTSGSCIATSTAHIAISFAQEDLNGGVYYWQSVAVDKLQGATGGIFRYDFGKRGQTPQAFLAPTASGGTMQRCIGCHFLSRDGQKMSYGNDDPDADDEYSDLNTTLIDVATKKAAQLAMNVGGFQAFTPDHALVLATDGTGGTMGTSTTMSLFDGNSGAPAVPATFSTGKRGTQPDYSADGKRVVFVEPASFSFSGTTYKRFDDNHFTGGSLLTMSASGTSFGTPAPLLASRGENNYYPAFSPDGGFVVFNRVPLSGAAGACTGTATTAGVCANDAFSNPNARVFIMPSSGGTPIDLTAINGAGALANSWPRFAPTVQMYKGHQIAWVTFSSTRDYGDVVRNSTPVSGAPQHLCYPPESPENVSTNKNVTTDPSCLQPQLWMAAIDLTAAGPGGGDPSFPAFWLPFQDSTAHNHIAQWVVQIVPPPLPDGGACIPGNGPCTPANDQCCDGICCSGTNTCGCIP
jgi:hypothetical protein